MGPSAYCPNALCHDTGRTITRIHAIAYSSGVLRDVIHKYKYEGKRGWALILARVLVGWLDDHSTDLDVDVIVANPSFGNRGHVQTVLDKAAGEDLRRRWPFDTGPTPILTKTAATDRSANRTLAEKRAIAQQVYEAVRVSRPQAILGRRVLVVDDVCTTGRQLDALARRLSEAGAVETRGVVLARAPWSY
jgi:predicted amidophosphoribosyltransferase